MKIFPAIDLKDGKCVRLAKGEYDKVTTYSDDPIMNFYAYEEFIGLLGICMVIKYLQVY